MAVISKNNRARLEEKRKRGEREQGALQLEPIRVQEIVTRARNGRGLTSAERDLLRDRISGARRAVVGSADDNERQRQHRRRQQAADRAGQQYRKRTLEGDG